MDSTAFWEENGSVRIPVKFESCNSSDVPLPLQTCKEEQSLFQFCDGNLNFATVATSEDDEFNFNKKKISRDPMSHRIIEKRRRDRMNNCLADLSRLIPADYLKKGRGRIEKTEIIEMAIKHMKHLQTRASKHAECDDAEVSPSAVAQDESTDTSTMPAGPINTEHYRLGYQECLSEAMHFMVEVEGFYPGDPLCVQLINHLQKHCDKILKGDRLNFPRTHANETTSNSSGSSGSYAPHHHHHGSNAHSSSGSPLSSKDDQSQHPMEEGGGGCCYDGGVVDLTSPSHHHHHTTHAPPTRHRGHAQHDVTAGQSAASLYKFKNNIKQRFSAEHHHHEDGTSLKRRRFEATTTATPQEGSRRHSDTSSLPSSPPSPEPPHSPAARTTYVPIFALHAKGSYYVPLTLDADLLAPYFNELNVAEDSGSHHSCDSSTTLVLHQVTISVNFKHTAAQHQKFETRLSRGLTLASSMWKSDCNSFVPVASWYQNERHPMALPSYNKNV